MTTALTALLRALDRREELIGRLKEIDFRIRAMADIVRREMKEKAADDLDGG